MRVRWIYVWIAYSLLMAGVSLTRTIRLYAQPPPIWMTHAHQWYEEAIAVAFFIFIAAASVFYLVRTRKWMPAIPAVPERWRERRELRAVLYGLAVILFVSVPLEIHKAVLASSGGSPPGRQSIWSGLDPGIILYPATGLFIIMYDRRRVMKESRTNNECTVCGYDLRATPDPRGPLLMRCPECGTSFGKNNSEL